MSDLRKKLIRLAYQKPELRGDLLPLIQKQASSVVFRAQSGRGKYEIVVTEKNGVYDGETFTNGRNDGRATGHDSKSILRWLYNQIAFGSPRYKITQDDIGYRAAVGM